MTAAHTITDLRRELEKTRIALVAAQSHLASHAEANAALHMAGTVMYSPLHAHVTAAIAGAEQALDRTAEAPGEAQRTAGLAAVLVDLDRCMHGRHQGDTCADCGGASKGNHHLRAGVVIGYHVHGKPIVMPSREHKHDPAAWRGTDPQFPDLVGVVGGPLIPCKVTEFTATTVPTRRVEGVGDLDATYEQTRQYVIRYRPKPIEATYMTGVSDEEIVRARQAVLETALQIVDEQQPPPGRVPTVTEGGEYSREHRYSPGHRYVLRAYRRANGLPTAGTGTPTAAEVNQAVTWWNQRQETQRG